jgi:halocyanin-like protein
MSRNEVSRRAFMTAAGAATAAGATATAAAQESPTQTEGGGSESGGNGTGGGGGGGKTVPVFGSYLSDANLYEEAATVDARSQDSITVAVGAGETGVAFDPPTIWVSSETTITWEWTGEGGGHNVVSEAGPAGFDSGSVKETGTYEYEITEDDAGITTYKCVPHETSGMKGGVAVGDDVDTTTIETGGGEGGPSVTIPDEALALTVATFIAMTATLGLGYFFMKYGGEYEPQ